MERDARADSVGDLPPPAEDCRGEGRDPGEGVAAAARHRHPPLPSAPWAQN